MPEPGVTSEVLSRFVEKLRRGAVSQGNGQSIIPFAFARELVREEPAAARRYIELQCQQAAARPGYLQSAFLIAECYRVELHSDCLTKAVLARARELGAEGTLQSIRTVADLASAPSELPARRRAREWWKTQPLDSQAFCDECCEPVPRGEGFAIRGRRCNIGEQAIDMGEELLCANCFERLPGGHAIQ